MQEIPIAKLLILDDEVAQVKALHQTLEAEGYSVIGFTSAGAALTAIGEQSFDLVLTDVMMPEMSGVAFLRAAFTIDPTLAGIVMTGNGTLDTAVQAMQAGALDYILKPFSLSAVLPVLTRVLAVRRVRMENIELHQAVGMYELSRAIEVAGNFDAVLQKVADAAVTQSRVQAVSILLPGGTGNDELRVVAARGDHAEDVHGKCIPLSEALSRCVLHGGSLSLGQPDCLDEPACGQSSLAGTLPPSPGNVFLPMLAAGRFIGILNFTFEHPSRPIAPGQIKALNILASAAASALDAASLLEQLRAAESQYRRLAESAADMIFRFELYPQRRFAYVNPAATSIVGYSPAEHYADPDLMLKIVHPGDRHLMETVLRGDFSSGSTITLRAVHRNGNAVWIEQRNTLVKDSHGQVIAIEGIGRDITERRNLEEQLRQSQKMEAIGLLAGGVAHDLNNMLSVIIGYSDLIVCTDEPTDRIVERIDQVKKAAGRGAVLTGQLLAFGRRQIQRPTVLNINTVVEESSRLLHRIIGEDVRIVTTLQAGLGSIHADSGQIEQVLMNLIVNSKAAMSQGGKITIETKNVTLDETRAAGIPCQPGSYVMLAVSDTGCGMDEAIQARIFEPFYTTKEAGKGTGLGLSIVYGIVKQSAGEIRVFSRPGQGTRFEILFPRSEQEVEQPTSAAAVPSGAQLGSETILLVEDNEAVRQLIGTILRNTGYKVLSACDGNEAVRVFDRHEGRIGLILTDVIMPDMSGPALVESLKRISPGIKVLYMSGYPGDAVASQLDPGIPLLQKPFTSLKLIEEVRGILDSDDRVPAIA